MAPGRSAVVALVFVATSLHSADKHSLFQSRYEAREAFLAPRTSLAGLDSLPPAPIIENPESGQRKSVGLAVLYSLLLPGMGEYYSGSFSTGKYFLAAEGVLWLGYAGMDIYGISVRNDARQFAVAHAGLSPSGKDDQYFVNVSNFLSIDEYNQQKLRDRTPDQLYDPAAGFSWQWDSDADRAVFRDQRITSERAFNNLRFVVAAIVVNHIASAINAARSVILHNRGEARSSGELQFGADVLGGPVHPQGVRISVVRTF